MKKSLKMAKHYVLGGKNKSLILIPIIALSSLVSGFIIKDSVNQILNGIIFTIFMGITIYGIFIEAPLEDREARALFEYLKENGTEVKSEVREITEEEKKERRKKEWLYIFEYEEFFNNLNIRNLLLAIKLGFWRNGINKKFAFILGILLSLELLIRGEKIGILFYSLNSIGVILSIIEGKLDIEEYKFWKKLCEKLEKDKR